MQVCINSDAMTVLHDGLGADTHLLYWPQDRVKVLRVTRHRIGFFSETFFPANLELNPTKNASNT